MCFSPIPLVFFFACQFFKAHCLIVFHVFSTAFLFFSGDRLHHGLRAVLSGPLHQKGRGKEKTNFDLFLFLVPFLFLFSFCDSSFMCCFCAFT